MSWDQAIERVPPVTCPRVTRGPMEKQKPSASLADWSVRAICSILLETARMGAHP